MPVNRMLRAEKAGGKAHGKKKKKKGEVFHGDSRGKSSLKEWIRTLSTKRSLAG